MLKKISKIEIGVIANKMRPDRYKFFIYRRAVILDMNESGIIESHDIGRWYKVRSDDVYIDRISEYIEKCRKGNVIDINDNIL